MIGDPDTPKIQLFKNRRRFLNLDWVDYSFHSDGTIYNFWNLDE